MTYFKLFGPPNLSDFKTEIICGCKERIFFIGSSNLSRDDIRMNNNKRIIISF